MTARACAAASPDSPAPITHTLKVSPTERTLSTGTIIQCPPAPRLTPSTPATPRGTRHTHRTPPSSSTTRSTRSAPRAQPESAFRPWAHPRRWPATPEALVPPCSEGRRSLVGDWERVAAETVAILRLEAGRSTHDRRLADLIGELTLKSAEFATWWNDHRVLRRTHGAKHYQHPVAGELHFSYESFQVPGDTEQTLCVYNVEPGSPTARSLRFLADWTTPQPARTEQHRW
ncbi:transcriptional regulator [Streptomyces sp. NPDC002463]|uniref:MmyB family transcriptional regulator n=1 Tax=Streptomyces sp. NPDC002463 TaxID=3364645 RepID=UPI0036B5BBE9